MRCSMCEKRYRQLGQARSRLRTFASILLYCATYPSPILPLCRTESHSSVRMFPGTLRCTCRPTWRSIWVKSLGSFLGVTKPFNNWKTAAGLSIVRTLAATWTSNNSHAARRGLLLHHALATTHRQFYTTFEGHSEDEQHLNTALS